MLISSFLFRLAITFIVGIAASSFLTISWFLIILAALSGFFIFILDNRSTLAVCLIGLSMGSAFLNYRIDQRLKQYDLWQAEEKVILLATVIDMPDNYPTGVRMLLKSDWLISAKSSELKGNISVFGEYDLKDYKLGQQVIVSGRMHHDSGDFQDYQMKENIQGSLFYPSIKPVGFNKYYIIPYLLSRIKFGAEKLIEQKLVEPQGSLLKAMMFGQRISQSMDLSEQLRRTGLSHIAVVSGMHLIILVQLILVLTRRLKMSVKRSAGWSLLIILFFVLLTGGRPSICRAGLMVGFGLLGSLIGRISQSQRAFIWAGFFLLIANPLLLRWDIGFQLSFGATAGLIYLMPQLKRLLYWLPGGTLRDLLSVTLSAQLAVAPLVAYHFGQISLIGPLANIIVVSFLPIIFSVGLIFLITGGFFMISLFLNLILMAVINFIIYFSGINWAAITWMPSPVLIVIYYLILGLIVFYFNQKEKSSFNAPGLC